MVIGRPWVEELRGRLPEQPPQRCARFVADYGLPEYDARLLTASKDMADFYEQVASQRDPTSQEIGKYHKDVSNWMLGDLSRLLNLQNQDISGSQVSPEHMVELITLVDTGAISVATAKSVLEEAFQSGDSPNGIVERNEYTQIRESSAVEQAVREVLDANPKAVADYLSGKGTAAQFLVGQVMRLTRGQAEPGLVNQLVAGSLKSLKQAAR